MGEVRIFKKGERLVVVELVYKSILVGYPDGGLVEGFPSDDHGLWRVIRGAILHKR